MHIRELAGRVEAGMLNPVQPHWLPQEAPGEFGQALQRAQKSAEPVPLRLHFSAHAAQRIEERAIVLEAPDHLALEQAMNTLEAKGARDALVVRDGSAFVVNVPNRTVITVLAGAEQQQRVFTQIDSALFI